MAVVSIKQQVAAMSDIRDERTMLVALAALTDAVQNLATKMDTLTAKLNADSGVGDTNYATDFASTTAEIVTD